jgi:RimJ/RimL family protein N-acetyltransferase
LCRRRFGVGGRCYVAGEPFGRDRAVWGCGIASRALALFLDLIPVRPLHARAAGDNAGSLGVLQKSGFTVVGTETSFATGRSAEIEETILRLD